MKKNLMSVLILVLVIVNLVFTALLTFSVMPATKNANKLIESVAQAIHLELNTGKTTGQNNIPLSDIEQYEVDGGEAITINLKRGSDGKDHYCVVKVYLSINKKHEDYATYGGTNMESSNSIIKDNIISVLQTYTKEEISTEEAKDEAKEAILERLQVLFDSDMIINMGFSSFICQ